MGLLTFYHIDCQWFNLIFLGFLGIVAMCKTLFSNTKFGKWLNFENKLSSFTKYFFSIGFLVFFAGFILMFASFN